MCVLPPRPRVGGTGEGVGEREVETQDWDLQGRALGLQMQTWRPLQVDMVWMLLTHVHPGVPWGEGTEVVPADESGPAWLVVSGKS